MNDTTTSRSRSKANDRSVPLLVAAASLVVAVVAAVLLFGVERPPPVELLEGSMGFTPPASIAWTVWTDGEQCLYVGDPRGGQRQLDCDDRGTELVGWTEQGILLRDWQRGRVDLVAIDPATGERSVVATDVDSVQEPPSEPDVEPGRSVAMWPVTEHENGILRVSVDETDQERTVLWAVEAPESYDVVNATPSPDGSAIALTDTAERLLVVPADGSSEPRLWSDEVEGHGMLVWEGTQPPV